MGVYLELATCARDEAPPAGGRAGKRVGGCTGDSVQHLAMHQRLRLSGARLQALSCCPPLPGPPLPPIRLRARNCLRPLLPCACQHALAHWRRVFGVRIPAPCSRTVPQAGQGVRRQRKTHPEPGQT